VLIPWISITYSHGEDELTATLDALRHGMRKLRGALEENRVNESFEGEAVKPVFRPFNRCRQSLCGRLYPDAPKKACCLD
jgi:glutamate-1-semialdehyde 2,1-aminomutase